MRSIITNPIKLFSLIVIILSIVLLIGCLKTTPVLTTL